MSTTLVAPLLDPDHSWAVVDVETSGFQPATGRVLSAALAIGAAGRSSGFTHSSTRAWIPGRCTSTASRGNG